MYLNLKTEYSFRSVFGHIKEIISFTKKQNVSFAGICDYANTFGHVSWERECLEAGIKPIFGITLPVFYDMTKTRRLPRNNMSFIALNREGLKEIYRLSDIAHQNFYYVPRVALQDVNLLSENVLILSGHSPDLAKLTHENLHLQLSPDSPIINESIRSIPPVACCDNYYPEPKDRMVYEAFADNMLRDTKTSVQHIPTYQEWLHRFPGKKIALENLNLIANDIDFRLEKAPMIKSSENLDIIKLCKEGAKRRKINLKKGDYKARFKREMKLIKEKEYVDYFLVVADLVAFAKKKMVVGHARGSSAGSLVCYLLGITEVDPLKYGLLFERFIDVNRNDLPDIDIDFQDDRINMAVKYLVDKYGKDNVSSIGNISRLKSKSSIIRYAKALKINIGDIEELKDSITGKTTIEEALKNSESGKQFIESFPNMKDVYRIENHASHSSVHAAGILVSTKPLTNYCGINSRTIEGKKQRIAMIDKDDAEYVNLLKIDALSLRTLTIIAEICDQIKKEYTWIYDIPLNDKKTYKLLNKKRYSGIFQIEGQAVSGLAKKMKIKTVEDISVLIALGRPGPLASGGANRYLKRRNRKDKVEYLDSAEGFINATRDTYGVMVYQEQVMQIARNYACMSWPEVSALRKAIGKKKGIEELKKIFIKSAKKQGHKKHNIKEIWENLETHGEYSFNLSHSISYAIIGYITAYLKAHFPLEFTVATLNHAKDDNSALKFLRDMVENEGIKYSPFHYEKSVKKWVVNGNKIYGSLLSLQNVGPAIANEIIRNRKTNKKHRPVIERYLKDCDTPFKYLYPAKQLYGEYYKKGRFSRPCRTIKEVKGRATWIFIGCMIKKNIRDMNEPALVVKRGGEIKESPTTFLQLIIEDDTDQIFCSVWSEEYEELGKEIAETGKEGKDWYMIKGHISNNKFRGVNIEMIKRITV